MRKETKQKKKKRKEKNVKKRNEMKSTEACRLHKLKYNLILFIWRYLAVARREELSGSRQKRRVIWRPLEGLSGGRQKRRVIWQPLEGLSGGRQKRRVIWRLLEGLYGGRQKRRLSGGRKKIDRFIRKKQCQISFKYELNIQNVKHKNEKFYKLAKDYVSQIKFDFCIWQWITITTKFWYC